jgi:predicted RNA binding protein YcfA (HicA-like mRNA interferase family)
MLTIDAIIDFLLRNNSLDLGSSCWPSLESTDDAKQIDWGFIFPKSDGLNSNTDGWLYGDAYLPEEDLQQLESILDGLLERQGSLSDEDIHARLSQAAGWDIAAWYQPIHFFGDDWGIFIKERSIRDTALMIAHFIAPSSVLRHTSRTWLKLLYRSALYIYFLHEQYHHKIECLGLRLHVIQRQSSYIPYHKLIYAGATGTDDQLEEALANAESYSRLNTEPYKSCIGEDVLRATRDFLAARFPVDPPGYRKASHYLTFAKFSRGENVLQAQVKELTLTPAQPADDWDLAPNLVQSFFPVTGDIWTVVPASYPSILPTLEGRIPAPVCSTKDMIKLLTRAGYAQVDGGKGSHIKLKKPGSPTMILPGNRSELSTGVTKTALRLINHKLTELNALISSL